MTPKPDRDRAVEALLRARRARHAEPEPPAGAPCPDASQLAAWADGSLSAREAAPLEAHLATCAHCEAVLAAFARSAAPAPPPFWRRWAVLVPLAAATAAAAVWFSVAPGRQNQVAPAPTVARLESPGLPAPPMVAPPQAAREVEPPTAAKPPVKESPASTRARGAAPRGLKTGDMTTDQLLAPSAKVVPGRPALGVPEPQPPAAPAPVFRSVQPPPLPSPPPPPVAAQAARADRPTDARSATVIAEAPLVDTKKIATVVEFASPMLDGFDQATVVTGGGDVSAVAGAAAAGAVGGGGGRGAGGRAGGRGGSGGGTPPQAEAAKPAGPTRWRILVSGGVEKASGDGAAWSPIAIDPTVRLTNGAAPSATTCWLVGRAGVVLVAKDAVHFVRMDIPVPLDLVRVTATATAAAVTVTAADGSTFTTVDGGLTWKKPTV